MNKVVASGCAIARLRDSYLQRERTLEYYYFDGQNKETFSGVSVKQKRRNSIRIETPVTDLTRLSW